MSEYQYYEFAAVDRLLSQEEMSELRELSSRADITPRSFTNEYQWGDFRGDPRKLMEKYFDAFIYMANWGTHRLMFRLPKELFNAKLAAKYCDDEQLSLHAKGESVVLQIDCSEEGGEWVETDNWMQALLPLREQLLAGDMRSLYLVWLRGVEIGEIEDDASEPPLPPGLGKLSEPLRLGRIHLARPRFDCSGRGGRQSFASGSSVAGQHGEVDRQLRPRPKRMIGCCVSLREMHCKSAARCRSVFAKPRGPNQSPIKSLRGLRALPRQLLELRESIAVARIAKEQKQEAQRKTRLERENARRSKNAWLGLLNASQPLGGRSRS